MRIIPKEATISNSYHVPISDLRQVIEWGRRYEKLRRHLKAQCVKSLIYTSSQTLQILSDEITRQIEVRQCRGRRYRQEMDRTSDESALESILENNFLLLVDFPAPYAFRTRC